MVDKRVLGNFMSNTREPTVSESDLNDLLCDCICPECNQDYSGLSIESSYELGVSRIKCSECGFSVEDNLCEEDLTEQFFQIHNQKHEVI